MKLLFVTQALDLDDPTLSVYHDWVAALAQRSESVIAICLKEGRHDLPANVQVYSLGKEKGSAPAAFYAARFLSLAWKLRHEYDRVFVHMNQEYLLIAGWLWKLLQKPMYMWRNHYAGSLLTDIAASFCAKTFCTSTHSYTAKHKKNLLMPVGVDLDRFGQSAPVRREPRSLLFLARMSPSKHPDVLIEALGILIARSAGFIASLYGTPLPQYEPYYENLKARAEQLGLHDRVRFHAGVPNEKLPAVYRSHDIFVNCSRSGMYDKTLFEAAASGCLVIAASDDFAAAAGPDSFFDGTAEDLAAHLERLLMLPEAEHAILSGKLEQIARANSLETLAVALATELRLHV